MSYVPAYTATDLATARRLVERSQRAAGAPFSEGFIRSARWGELVGGRGGRTGDVRFKLYLSITLLAVSGDNAVDGIPASAWARVIGLDDPDGRGARRIQDALRWLAEHHYVRVSGGRGAPPSVQLLNPYGPQTPGVKTSYSRPSGGTERWTTAPKTLWTNGWVMALSGRALAVLIVLIDHRTRGGVIPTLTKEQIGLSSSTWTRALRELQAPPALVKITREVRPAYDPELGWRRQRNIYELFLDHLSKVPPKALLTFDGRNP